MAIADAVLRYLVEEKRSKTLFITHYPMVATDLEKAYPKDVQNLHMRYHTETRIDGRRTIAFLYQLTRGLAPGQNATMYASLHNHETNSRTVTRIFRD